MLLKLGVDISRLDWSIRSKLTVIDQMVADVTGSEAVGTSTWEGTHSPGSLHYQHKAIDIRRPQQLTLAQRVVTTLKQRLGVGYDIVLEDDHIHIEYDPK